MPGCWDSFGNAFGGLFLAFGLLTRLTAIRLIINFMVAYLTTEMESLKKLADLSSFPDLNNRWIFRCRAVPLSSRQPSIMLAFRTAARFRSTTSYGCWTERDRKGARL